MLFIISILIGYPRVPSFFEGLEFRVTVGTS